MPVVLPEQMAYGMLGGLAGALLVYLWWLFASRAPWVERLGAVALTVLAIVATRPLLDKSIAGGAMGMLFYILVIPILAIALVAWAVATRHLPDGMRRATMAATIVVACGAWTLVRTGGFDTSFRNDFAWRWSQTPEERLLAAEASKPLPPPTTAPPQTLAAPVAAPSAVPSALPSAPPASIEAAPEPLVADAGATAAAPARTASWDTNWPGFRGPERDGVVRGSRIRTDWSASPPVELWRREVGPGWSSFAVRGDVLYTQEQRGDEEVVASYRVATGDPIWRHRDAARFWESNAGAGPRGTPSLAGGRVYTLGATGIVNALDARDGTVAWTRNAAADTGAKVPVLGLLRLAPRGRRPRGRPRFRRPGRIRRGHRPAALEASRGGRGLQLAAPRHDRRRRPDPAAERNRHAQRGPGRRRAAVGPRVEGLSHRAARADPDGDVLIASPEQRPAPPRRRCADRPAGRRPSGGPRTA